MKHFIFVHANTMKNRDRGDSVEVAVYKIARTRSAVNGLEFIGRARWTYGDCKGPESEVMDLLLRAKQITKKQWSGSGGLSDHGYYNRDNGAFTIVGLGNY